MRIAQSGGSGVRGRPEHHRRNRQQQPAGDRLRGETDTARRITRGVEESSAVYRTCGHGTEGVQSPGTDNPITETDHRPTDTTVPTSGVRPLNIRTTARQIEEGTGRRQVSPQNGWDGRRPTTGTGRYDTGWQTIARGSPSFEDAFSQCAIRSGSGSPDSPPATRGPKIDVSRLPGLFRIGSSAVEMLDRSTADGHTTEARQLSRQTVEDAVSIEPPEGDSLRPDCATRPGRRRYRAGGPHSFYTTAGSSLCGPRPSSHRGTENAGN